MKAAPRMAVGVAENQNEMSAVRVLIVDDDPLVLSALKRVLRSASAPVHCASGAAEAISWVRAGGEPWVIISDQTMPSMSGIELLQWMRSELPRAFIILHTGDTQLQVSMAEALVLTLIAKPAEPAALRALVMGLLRARGLGNDAP